MTNMKKFDALFVFLDEYRKMDQDEKIFCQKVLMSFNASIPIVITKEDVLWEPESFIPKEEQLPKESVSIKPAAAGMGIQSQCNICGRSFIKTNNKQIYCCHACAVKASKMKSWKFTKTCLVCWKIYKTHLETSKYCSLPCKYTANKWENHWKNRWKKKDSVIINKKDDPFFKPKFIFWN